MEHRGKIHRFLLRMILIMTIISFHACHKAVRTGIMIFENYEKFIDDTKLMDPREDIEYLKKTRFHKAELDSLPSLAIILHDTRIKMFLDSLNIPRKDITILETGITDMTILYVVRNKQLCFVISPGLPGSGGISTQVAEFAGMGIKKLIHIGTCGVFSDQPVDFDFIISGGCYKEGATVLLSTDNGTISYPDMSLTAEIKQKIKERTIRATTGLGFTIPIFYYQPEKLLIHLARWQYDDFLKPLYIEMEGSAVFETGRITNIKTASIVIPTDRYYLEQGALKHEFIDFDHEQLKLEALRICASLH